MTLSDPSSPNRLKLLGETIPVRTQGDDTTVDMASQRLTERIQSTREQAEGASRLQIALLAGLNLAGELVQQEKAPENDPIAEETYQRIEETRSSIKSLLSEVTVDEST